MIAIATRMFANAPQSRGGLIVSIVGHALVLAFFAVKLSYVPARPMPQLAIEAMVVDESAINRAAEEQQRKVDDAKRREREQQQAKQQQDKAAAEAKRVEQQRKEQAAEQRRVDQQRKETEAKAAAAKQKQQAEADRVAREKQQAEAARKEKERVKAEAERLERERVAAEARAKAEAERREQARRQAELATTMEAEEALFAAQRSGEVAVYKALIQQKVERKWNPPPSIKPGLKCEVIVQQLPSGEVTDVRTGTCNGDEAVRRSIESAVAAASPLPLPDNRALFDRHLVFIFDPEE